MNVLLFENSPLVRIMIEKNLNQFKESLVILSVDNMNFVMDAICNSKFELILIDMDNMKGLFTLFIETARSTNGDAVIILLTSFQSEIISQRFINSGVDYCLDKVTEFEKLIKLVSELANEVLAKSKDLGNES